MSDLIVTEKTEISKSEYWQGFDAYCDGAQLEEMPTPAHVRGWWAALDAQVSTEDYEAYQEYQRDLEWSRRGAW